MEVASLNLNIVIGNKAKHPQNQKDVSDEYEYEFWMEQTGTEREREREVLSLTNQASQ